MVKGGPRTVSAEPCRTCTATAHRNNTLLLHPAPQLTSLTPHLQLFHSHLNSVIDTATAPLLPPTPMTPHATLVVDTSPTSSCSARLRGKGKQHKSQLMLLLGRGHTEGYTVRVEGEPQTARRHIQLQRAPAGARHSWP